MTEPCADWVSLKTNASRVVTWMGLWKRCRPLPALAGALAGCHELSGVRTGSFTVGREPNSGSPKTASSVTREKTSSTAIWSTGEPASPAAAAAVAARLRTGNDTVADGRIGATSNGALLDEVTLAVCDLVLPPCFRPMSVSIFSCQDDGASDDRAGEPTAAGSTGLAATVGGVVGGAGVAAGGNRTIGLGGGRLTLGRLLLPS